MTLTSEPIFLHDTLACDAALPYHVWHQNDLWFRRYTDKHSLVNILNLCCDLDLELSNPIFAQNTLAYNVVLVIKPSLVANGPVISSFGDIVEIVIFCL